MRIRTVKPEFFTHEELFDLEENTGLPIRMAFIGLWCVADREGRFKWHPRRIGVQILPYDGVDFNLVLNALMGAGIIQQYEVDGELYGYIPSFLDHQCINQREAQSKLPNPECTETHVQTHSSRVAANIPAPTRAEVMKRDKGECVRCQSKSDLTIDHIFPKSIGGNHASSNLRVLCRSCNSARPVAGQALIDDLATDGYSMDDMKRTCMHVQARGEGKGMEQGREHVPPKSPKGDNVRLTKADKKRTKVESNTRIMQIVGGWFSRRPDTLWTIAEAEALEQIKPSDDDLEMMGKYYSSDCEYLRRDITTLLNNWSGEMDRARSFVESSHKLDRPGFKLINGEYYKA